MSTIESLISNAENAKVLAQQEVIRLSSQLEKLNTQIKDAKEIDKLAPAFLAHLQNHYYFHILELWSKQGELIQRMAKSCHPAYQEMESIFEASQIEAKKLDPWSVHFPRAFSQACQVEQLPIDSDSRHPKYTFDNRFFEVKLDEAKKVAHISNYEAGTLASIPADVSAILKCLQKHRKRVFEKAQDGQQFLKLLRQEYLENIKSQGKKDGDSMPIRPIILNLSNKKGGDQYRSDEFVVALSQILKDQRTKIDGFQLDLQQTKDTKAGILPITNTSRGYVGFLLFTKISSLNKIS